MAETVASEWRLTGIIALDDRLPAVSSVYRASTLDPKAVVPPHLRSSPKEVIADALPGRAAAGTLRP